ncbi:hypothetical protein L6R52_13035 [Myxococcota bacterium]|nr:hypothetical protein [Myxococcota bacterium]
MRLSTLALTVVFGCTLGACASTQFSMAVPKRSPVIKRTKLVVELNGIKDEQGHWVDIGATFEITDPGGRSPTVLTPGASFSGVKYGMAPITGELASGDVVTVRPATGLAPDDERKLRFVVEFAVTSDFDGATCNPTPPTGSESWTVKIKSATVKRACVLTETLPAGTPCATPPVFAPTPPLATLTVLEPTTGDSIPGIVAHPCEGLLP